MSRKQTATTQDVRVAVVVETEEENPGKRELQRQMEEAREAITETVSEIKGVVTHQYEEVREKVEAVKDGVSEVLDWREQFNENPLVWGAGAVSVGILIGIGLSHAFEETHTSGGRRKKTDVSALGGHLIGEVSGLASAVLPTLTGKVKEMFGVDLAAYLPGVTTHQEKSPRKKSSAQKKTATKKSIVKKSVPKKRATKKKLAK